MNRHYRVLVLLLLPLIFAAADAFVVIPRNSNLQRRRVATLQQRRPSLSTCYATTRPTSGEGGTENRNFLAKAANKVGEWLKPLRFGGGTKTEKETGSDLYSPLQVYEKETALAEKEMKEALSTFPWPARVVANSITNKVHRELQKEQRKAKPVLREALKLMEKDQDLKEVMGTPIKLGRMMGQSTTKSVVSGTGLHKTTQTEIHDTFEVVGSCGTLGVATVVADKYAKGHIKALRVNVRGVHYDIDV